MEDTLQQLTADLLARTNTAGNKQRTLLGITGPPGAGKSTISRMLVDAVNHSMKSPAVVVPMDGFHLDNEILVSKGNRHLKGVPETFDGEGFLALVKNIKLNLSEPVPYPLFDRKRDCVIPAAAVVEPGTKLIVIEGNYLLCDDQPWHQLRYYLDEVWYVDAPEDILYNRLIARHIEGGMSLPEAKIKVESTDFPNASLVSRTRSLADRRIENF